MLVLLGPGWVCAVVAWLQEFAKASKQIVRDATQASREPIQLSLSSDAAVEPVLFVHGAPKHTHPMQNWPNFRLPVHPVLTQTQVAQ